MSSSGKPLLFFYLVIVVTWMFTGLYRYLNPEIISDSPIVAQFIESGDIKYVSDITNSASLHTIEFAIKVNLFVFDFIFGLVFLGLIVFPKLKQKHLVLMFTAIIAGYLLPKIGTAYIILNEGSEALSYTTFNDLLIWLVFTPLNWAVFLYGYYLLENYYIKD